MSSSVTLYVPGPRLVSIYFDALTIKRFILGFSNPSKSTLSFINNYHKTDFRACLGFVHYDSAISINELEHQLLNFEGFSCLNEAVHVMVNDACPEAHCHRESSDWSY